MPRTETFGDMGTFHSSGLESERTTNSRKDAAERLVSVGDHRATLPKCLVARVLSAVVRLVAEAANHASHDPGDSAALPWTTRVFAGVVELVEKRLVTIASVVSRVTVTPIMLLANGLEVGAFPALRDEEAERVFGSAGAIVGSRRGRGKYHGNEEGYGE